MRSVITARVLQTTGLAACLLLGSAAVGEDRASTPASAWPRSAPELRPGEIVIKRTGKKRVAAARTAAPVIRNDRPAELSYAGPGPRVVTIGYLVRDEIETGWGPQVHCPAPSYAPSYSSPCDSYGYNSYLPSYGSYGASCGTPFFFGSSSYCPPVAPMSHAFRGR